MIYHHYIAHISDFLLDQQVEIRDSTQSNENNHLARVIELIPDEKMQEIDLSLKSLGKQLTIQPVKQVKEEEKDVREDSKNYCYYERFQQHFPESNISTLFQGPQQLPQTSDQISSTIQLSTKQTSTASNSEAVNAPVSTSIAAAAAAAAARFQLISHMFSSMRSQNQIDLQPAGTGLLLDQSSTKEAIPSPNSLLSAATARAIAASAFASFQANSQISSEIEDNFLSNFGSSTGISSTEHPALNSTLPGPLMSAAAVAASGYQSIPNIFMPSTAGTAGNQGNTVVQQSNGNALVFHNGTEKRGRGRPPKYGMYDCHFFSI